MWFCGFWKVSVYIDQSIKQILLQTVCANSSSWLTRVNLQDGRWQEDLSVFVRNQLTASTINIMKMNSDMICFPSKFSF